MAQPLRSESAETREELHTILGCYMKDREADAIILSLAEVMEDDVDGPEFVRLMQKWMASS